MCEKKFDITIIGGGVIGSALAIGLIKKNFSVAIVEKIKISKFSFEDNPDIRVSAINMSSVNFLKNLNVWSIIKEMRLHPYRQLKTWEYRIAEVNFSSDLLGLTKLGYMIENNVLQSALWKKLKKKVVLYHTSLKKIKRDKKKWKIKLFNNVEIKTKLIIGADGFNSQIRKFAGIKTDHYQYNHSCLLISVKSQFLSGDTTWQKITPLGIYAFLPLINNWASLVLYDTPNRIKNLLLLPNNTFKQEIKKKFFYDNYLSHDFFIYNKKFLLLNKLHANCYVKTGLVIIGDAAHTINPIAGQGLNIGYKDIQSLINILYKSRDNHEDWCSRKVLQRYNDERYCDNLFIQNSIDAFQYIFQKDDFLLKLIRNLGMIIFQKSSFLKKKLLIYASGIDLF